MEQANDSLNWLREVLQWPIVNTARPGASSTSADPGERRRCTGRLDRTVGQPSVQTANR
jgi:hypothetical protein